MGNGFWHYCMLGNQRLEAMVTVLLHSLSHYPVDRNKLRNGVIAYLEKKVPGDVEVSITIVGTRRMKALNTMYRNKPYATDVLSFPTIDPSQPSDIPFVPPPDDVLRLGDLVVCYPKAREEAMEEKKLVDEQILFLLYHGIEHLLGHHHPE